MLRVSVIIPTYNRAEYLPQALQSVFDQSFSPFEVIVIDDGSTDNTATIMQSWAPKARYFQQKNQGVSAARNRGLEVSCGDVIAWLDSDDLWEPDFLKTTVSKLEAEPGLGGVHTGLIRINSEGSILPQTSQEVVPALELYSSLIENCHIQTSSFVAHKRCFEEAGPFDTNFDICEDYDMFLRLTKVCRIAGLPQPLVRYRVHDHNTVNDPSAFCQFRLALMEKHFGKCEGNPATWTDEKRLAHACALRAAALKCIQSGQSERGWQYLEKGISIWPDLLSRLDTFYELICSDQPPGYRGHAESLDIVGNGTKVLKQLDALFANADPTFAHMHRHAYGNAHLALAMLSDQAGHWSQARRFLFGAIAANPRLLFSPPVIRRLLKLYVGRRLVGIK